MEVLTAVDRDQIATLRARDGFFRLQTVAAAAHFWSRRREWL